MDVEPEACLLGWSPEAAAAAAADDDKRSTGLSTALELGSGAKALLALPERLVRTRVSVRGLEEGEGWLEDASRVVGIPAEAAVSVSTIPEVSTARMEDADRINGGVSKVVGRSETDRAGGRS